MHPMATNVNKPAQMRETASVPKLSRPIDSPPRMTVKLSQERNVRSLAKKTLGSTRVGRAMRLPGAVWRRGWEDILAGPDGKYFEAKEGVGEGWIVC